MRVLFLSPYVPYPVRDGGRLRAEGLIRCLTRFSEVHVLAVGEPRDADSVLSQQRLAAQGVALDVFGATGPDPGETNGQDVARDPDAVPHFRSPGLAAAVSARSRDWAPDVVHFEELVMAQYAAGVTAPRVLDRQKIEWAFHEALAAGAGSEAEAHRREASRFRRFEAATAGLFARTLVTGESDRRLLESIGAPAVDVVPNGVDEGIVAPTAGRREVREVLLYGTLDYAPNVEANAFYFREVWPLLARTHPELRTLVVGSGPAPAALRQTGPRVDLRGYVPEIAPLLQGPRVLVVPLRVGGGVRNKILQALAAGMPVVSTAVGVENLGLVHGRHYWNAETAEEMAAAVTLLVRDPARAEALGRDGAAYVDGAFRWDSIAARLEPIYAGLARNAQGPRTPLRRRRALLIGVRPLPEESTARGLSFPGHRTAQFLHALAEAECDTETVLLDEEPGAHAGGGAGRIAREHVLPPESFRSGQELQRLHDRFAPDVVVSAGGYHAARVATLLVTDRPRLIDLAGDLAAEGQARAAEAGDGALADPLAVLARALELGDRFAVVGPSQRLALLGQLGLAGRLTGARLGDEPVVVVPVAASGPSTAPLLSPEGLRVLWSGGYNTWMDGDTLFRGVEQAMMRRPEVVFVSTGGGIVGHHEEGYRRFWSRVRASRFADRFVDHGRVPRVEAIRILAESHVALAVSRPCLEAELGSRQRLVEAMAYGRPVVATALGDLARSIDEARAGIVVPAGDGIALADALVRLAEDRPALMRAAVHARTLWQARYTYAAATPGIAAWLREPTPWPRSVLDAAGMTQLAAERLRLQAELDAIRSSRTFRALRTFDRLLGRR
jgi:glycosyltransferase involved in cell wall biosynthesis